jgi:molecular chaperone DnaK
MKNYVGIDLGTTNSAICSYDGEDTRIWKSPEQNDVTPSVIYFDRRAKYVGRRAYDNAPTAPDRTAMLFKRFMGTSTPIEVSGADKSLTPEECSAEILKVLFGYLPEEIRNDDETGTVITVPAAFNQMQKNATMQAADMAGIGKVALMQEPVAAVMSVMRTKGSDGMFLIYDLGGGTLDISIAESIGGRVNLLAHGGIAMCGGRDFDRVLSDNVVKPWLLDNFNLPDDFSVNSKFGSLFRRSVWATESAKIELSSQEEVTISLSEDQARTKDISDEEIYLDITLSRESFDKLIEERINESIEAARETLKMAGLSAHDLERIVFVGGPTNYKPLRDRVAFELGLPGSTDVNPMTAVAEGASMFAESIEWGSQTRTRKSTRGQISSSGKLDLSFAYIARTPGVKAKIAVQLKGNIDPGSEFQIESMDTGWTSGRMSLQHGATVDVTLSKNGENTFKADVFDPSGGPISLEESNIIITRTAATVDAIPASHSISMEVLNKLGGRPEPDFLIKAGDQLPAKGSRTYKAAESLKAGSSGTLIFNIWEGDIKDPITDNRPIGSLKISGSDFDDGVIPAGANLEVEYEILDSGNINLSVSIPTIGGSFSPGKNFYSRAGGEHNFLASSELVVEEGERTMTRVDELNEQIDDPKLDRARRKLQAAVDLDPDSNDPEVAQEAMEKVHESRRLLDKVKQDHLKEIRQMDLDSAVDFFNQYIREHARPTEISTFDNLTRTAQRSIDKNDSDFDHHLDELRGKNFDILWRQDWFVVERFKSMASSPYQFTDKQRFEELVLAGQQFLRDDDIDKLREVVAHLYTIHIGGAQEAMTDVANILRG